MISNMSLEENLRLDFEYLGLPKPYPCNDPILDVAIIGGGQSGMSLCLALRKRDIFNVAIFDQSEAGAEGPWATTARMRTLRSGKELPGPALDIPHLTFRAWYEEKKGGWDSLEKIPTLIWAEYLFWYREALDLPVKNGWRLLTMVPEEGHFRLLFEGDREVLARKVVLATGRDGCGGFELPKWSAKLPKDRCFHTGQVFDPKIFQGQRVCVVGAAASAFDAAATALENGAKRVDMLMRRAILPERNPLADVSFWSAYSSMKDEQKIKLFQNSCQMGTVIPSESVERAEKWPNFLLHNSTEVSEVSVTNEICLKTQTNTFKADIVILATGYCVDVFKVAELAFCAEEILLWKDVRKNLSDSRFGKYPYLGDRFQFQGEAPFLKNIYCFNYGAFLSHGRCAGDIDQLPIGIERLAEGIAISLVLDSQDRVN